jgi:hypothetical protein
MASVQAAEDWLAGGAAQQDSDEDEEENFPV